MDWTEDKLATKSQKELIEIVLDLQEDLNAVLQELEELEQ